MKIPEGYQTVMPYLIIEGAEEFQKFMTEVFGAKEKMKIMRNESLVMHAEIIIGTNTIMFADSTSEYKPQTAGLFIYVEDADSTFKKAIEKGAISVLELSDQEYGRSGGVRDKWGNTFWITSVK